MTAVQPSDSRPIYRNPFVIAFVIGVATLTFLRPHMRNIPDAPPETGALPGVELIDREGSPVTNVGDAAVTLVGFADADVEDCGASRLLSKLWHMYRSESLDVEVVMFSLRATDAKALRRLESRWGGPRDGLRVVGPATEEAAEELRAATTAHVEAWTPIREAQRRPRPPLPLEPWPDCEGDTLLEWVTLVDDDMQTRGFYRVSDWEVESELFHRSHRLLFVP